MPVSRHRRRGKSAAKQPSTQPEPSRRTIGTIDDLRQVIADSTLDFAARTTIAGVWWFQQLLRKVGDRRTTGASKKDAARAALLLCVAMDGERGRNDDLSPAIAAMLRPHCPAGSFAEAWEMANHLPPGAVAATAARILATQAKSSV